MDRSRVLILGLAAVAAIVAALIVRGLFGGAAKPAAAIASRPVAAVSVLVAASDIRAGAKLTPEMVKWQSWPQANASGSFITTRNPEELAHLIDGMVAREPMIAGEPVALTKIVRAQGAGFMSARLQEGMRAVSIDITDSAGTAGFILPDDRVDVLLAQPKNEGGETKTILHNVRVLAIGQTYKQSHDDVVISGKTATLEVTPGGAEKLSSGIVKGTVTLALCPLVDASGGNVDGNDGSVSVLRYGVRTGGGGMSFPLPATDLQIQR